MKKNPPAKRLDTVVASPLTATCRDDQIVIYRKDANKPLVTQQALPNHRPYLHPLLAPDGLGILTEDAPPHHPWQHGLYVGLNRVNGAGFWHEGLAPGKHPHDGSFHPAPLQAPRQNGNAIQWEVRTAWCAPDGVPLLNEIQDWTLRDAGATYALDMIWTLTAATDITFGQYAYGGLFLRMPFRSETGGQVLTSEGRSTPAEAEAQRARWVAVCMPIEGRSGPAGIALMDHPSNPEHPVPWRVDSQLGIAPSRCIAGDWHLKTGQSCVFRHRVFVFCGDIDRQSVEASWNAFASYLNLAQTKASMME